MHRSFSRAAALAAAALAGLVSAALAAGPEGPTPAGTAPRRHPVNRHPVSVRPGYGFLPGFEPQRVVVPVPETLERRPAFWYGGPQFYRGRWNGGGFGPCWVQTPIGNHWTCG